MDEGEDEDVGEDVGVGEGVGVLERLLGDKKLARHP